MIEPYDRKRMLVILESYLTEAKKWMQKAAADIKKRGTKGSYRALTHTKPGHNIPLSREKNDAKKKGAIGKKARLALAFRKAKH